MPTALACADRHMIGVASQFIGWVFMDTYKWKTEPRSGEKPAAWKKRRLPLRKASFYYREILKNYSDFRVNLRKAVTVRSLSRALRYSATVFFSSTMYFWFRRQLSS